MVTVYVVEIRDHEDREAVAVYTSADAAMAAYPVPPGALAQPGRPVGWQKVPPIEGYPERWSNGVYGDKHVEITAVPMRT